MATYQNHNDWLSEIALDYLNFVTTYGTTVIATLTDIYDGTISASLTIFWAADYTLVVTVNGIDLIDSPWSSGLKVLPAGLDATSCVVAAIPTQVGGYEYYFLIQARDEFSNNLKSQLGDEVGNDHSALY